MNRKHTRQEYLKIVQDLRKNRKDIALSSDFIVAFPGETDDDFEQTIDLVEKVKYSQCFSFKYSPRPGTPAALIEEQISDEIANKRLYKLQELLAKQQREFNESCMDVEFDVLFEIENQHKGIRQITGKSPYLQAVSVDILHENMLQFIGKISRVKIVEVKKNSLIGKIIS